MKKNELSETKTNMYMLCPVCQKSMTIGKAEDKIVACCENKKCETIVVFGDPMQELFKGR